MMLWVCRVMPVIRKTMPGHIRRHAIHDVMGFVRHIVAIII